MSGAIRYHDMPDHQGDVIGSMQDGEVVAVRSSQKTTLSIYDLFALSNSRQSEQVPVLTIEYDAVTILSHYGFIAELVVSPDAFMTCRLFHVANQRCVLNSRVGLRSSAEISSVQMTREDATSCLIVVAFADGHCILINMQFVLYGEPNSENCQAIPVELTTFASVPFPSDHTRPTMLCYSIVPDQYLISSRITCCDMSGCLLALGYASGQLNVVMLPHDKARVCCTAFEQPRGALSAVAVAFPRVAVCVEQNHLCTFQVSFDGRLSLNRTGDMVPIPSQCQLLLLSRRGATSSLIAVCQSTVNGSVLVATEQLQKFDQLEQIVDVPPLSVGSAGPCSIVLVGHSCVLQVDIPSSTNKVFSMICQKGADAFGPDLGILLTAAHVPPPHTKQKMYRLCVEHQLMGPLAALLSSGGVYPPDASTLRVWARSYFAAKKTEVTKFYDEALTIELVNAKVKSETMEKTLAALGSLFYVYEYLAGIPQTEPRLLKELSEEGNDVLCEAQRLELVLYFLKAGRLPFESHLFGRRPPDQFSLADYLYAPLYTGELLGVADGCRRYPPASLRELLQGVATRTQLIAQHKHAVVLYILYDTCSSEFIDNFCSFFSVLPDWRRKIEACWLLDNNKSIDRAASLLCECKVDAFLTCLAQELPRKFLALGSPVQALHVAKHLGQTVERRLMVEVLSANDLVFEAAMLVSNAESSDQVHFFRALGDSLKKVGAVFPMSPQMETAWMQVARERKRQDWIVLYLLHRDRVDEALQLWKNEKNSSVISNDQVQTVEMMLEQRGQLAQTVN